MIFSKVINKEVYVYIAANGKVSLLYKRWLKHGFGMVMDRQPFTAKDTESFNQSIKDSNQNTNKN